MDRQTYFFCGSPGQLTTPRLPTRSSMTRPRLLSRHWLTPSQMLRSSRWSSMRPVDLCSRRSRSCVMLNLLLSRRPSNWMSPGRPGFHVFGVVVARGSQKLPFFQHCLPFCPLWLASHSQRLPFVIWRLHFRKLLFRRKARCNTVCLTCQYADGQVGRSSCRRSTL